MWFAFSLVSLGLLLTWQFRSRWFKSWSGTPGGGRKVPPHHFRYLQRRDNIFALELGVQVPDFFRFELKRERWIDRFFKWLGLSVEKQFGHESFDRLVYVASDDMHLLNRVADSPELRAAAQHLFVQEASGCKVRRVRCAHGWLVVRIDRGKFWGAKRDAWRLEEAMNAALPFLNQIGQALRHSAPPELPVTKRDRTLLPGLAVLSVSTALAVNGAVFLLLPFVFDDAFLLDTARLLELTLWVGSFIFLALLGAHFLLLARSARAHLYLLELVLVGTFGAYSSAVSGIRQANIEWDTAPTAEREAPVVSKSISRYLLGGSNYFLHVTDWQDRSQTREIKVSRSVYESVDIGRALVFEERPGHFGAAWARFVGARSGSAQVT